MVLCGASDGALYCVAANPLVAVATSSASVLLTQPPGSVPCCPAEFEVLVQHRRADGLYEPWAAVQAPVVSRRLPLEVMIECEHGCALKLSALDAEGFAAKAERGALSLNNEANAQLIFLGAGVHSAVSEDVVTPRAPQGAPFPPAARLEFFLRPPLIHVSADSALPAPAPSNLAGTAGIVPMDAAPVQAARAFVASLVSSLSPLPLRPPPSAILPRTHAHAHTHV